MSSEHLSHSALIKLIPLVEKREKLQAELATVEQQIASVTFGSGSGLPGRGTSKVAKVVGGEKKASARGGKRGRRGALKEAILAELKAAGAKGVAVKDISSKLGVKSQNVHVWFSSTGRKLGIKKKGKGIYALGGK